MSLINNVLVPSITSAGLEIFYFGLRGNLPTTYFKWYFCTFASWQAFSEIAERVNAFFFGLQPQEDPISTAFQHFFYGSVCAMWTDRKIGNYLDHGAFTMIPGLLNAAFFSNSTSTA